MKYLISLYSLTFLISCGQNSQKDPWPGIGDVQLKTQSFGKKAFDLASHIKIEKVDKETSLEITFLCEETSSQNKNKKVTFLKPYEIKNTLSVAELMPIETVLSTKKTNVCSIQIKAINPRHSSDITYFEKYKLNTQLLSHQKLFIQKSNKILNTSDETPPLLEYHRFNEFNFNSKLKEGLSLFDLMCAKNHVKSKNHNLIFTSFSIEGFDYSDFLMSPIQNCRALARSSDGHFFISNIFQIKAPTPRPTLISSTFLPNLNSDISYYQNSDRINHHLLNVIITNRHPFPIYFNLVKPSSTSAHIYAVTPDYELRPLAEKKVQEIPATIHWETSKQSDNSLIILEPNEVMSFDLYLNTSFNCRYNKLKKLPVRNGADFYHEDGYIVLLKNEDLLTHLLQVQVNKNNEPTVIEKDTLQYLNQYETYSSRINIHTSEKSFFEHFFFRRINYPRPSYIKQVYAKNPAAAYWLSGMESLEDGDLNQNYSCTTL